MRLLLLLALLSSTSFAQTNYTGKESIEWCDIWVSNANQAKLPRVLLIGDSITRGYYPEVEKNLSGKAYVSRLSTSAFVTDPALLAQIAAVLENNKFDIIHFNNGMHGWGHSEKEYEAGLLTMMETIRKYAPNAKLIWAATTPLKDSTATNPLSSAQSTTVPLATEPGNAKAADAGKLMLLTDLKQVSDARIDARNAIALEIMRREQIPVDDLHTLSLGHPELYNGSVHFNKDGTALQGKQVATEVAKLLP